MTTRKQIAKYKAAHKTLEHLGYTYHGGELWAPPIGTKPNFDLIDRLRADALFDKNLNESLQDSLAVRTKERDELAASVATARNEALEEAALISDSLAEDWSFAANRISKNIRALKEPK